MSDTITDIYTNNKRFIWVIIGVLCLLVIITFLYDHFGPSVSTVRQDTQTVNRQVDSLKQWATTLQKRIDSSNLRITNDSIRYTSVINRVSHVPQMIQTINKRHAIQIHIIDTLSASEQSALFANWITKSDSL